MATSPPPANHPQAQTIVLYGKPGCHLCENAEELLEELAEKWRLHIQHVDITSDLLLFEMYKYTIPVVQRADGQTIAGRIQRADLEALLNTP